jgi:hypothetical protein
LTRTSPIQAQSGFYEIAFAILRRPRLPASFIGFFDGAVQPHLDQMQHAPTFNIGWHEQPKRRISSFIAPRDLLTKPGIANHAGSHAEHYPGFPPLVRGGPVQTEQLASSWHPNK